MTALGPTSPRCHALRAHPGALPLLPLLAVLAATVSYAAPDVMTILGKSSLAETNLAFSGLRSLDLYHDGHLASQVQQSLVRAPGGRERIETLSRGHSQGRLAVSDGRVQWEYYPRERRCVKRPLPTASEVADHRSRSLRRIAANLRPRLAGTEGFLGRKAYRVEITTPDGQRVRASWVDTVNYLELRADCYEPGGRLGSRTYFTHLTLGGPAAPGLFTFTPPAGVQVRDVPRAGTKLPLAQAEQKAGFHAYLPAHLPAGYVLCDEETAVLHSPEQGVVLWVVFGNGLDSFSLFQSRSRKETEAACRCAQCWHLNGMTLTLVGQLGSREMARVRASVKQR